MKRSLFLWLAWLCLPLAAQEKKDIELKTEVAEVTVFIKGAQVLRKTAANFPAGRSAVRFVDLSPYIDAKSIQVKVDGEVMVLSVDRQLNYNDTVKLSGELETLRRQRLELVERHKVETAQKEALNEEMIFLTENRHIGGQSGVDFNNLKMASTYYGERLSALKLKVIEADRRILDLLKAIEATDRRTAVAGQTRPEPTGEVVLNVDCRTAVHAPVELTYYVANAGWYPSYDIRAKSIAEPVELAYKANVMQNTKERWRNVRLKVSSANPNLGNVAPQLKTYRLDYHTRPPRYDTDNLTGQVSGRITGMDGQPLPGVSVAIKGSTIGTASDLSGHYDLSIPAGGGELVLTCTGYRTKIAPIRGGSMDFRLEDDDGTDEEVVAAGYGIANDAMEEMAIPAPAMRDAKLTRAEQQSIPVPVAQVETQTAVEFDIRTPYTIPSENRSTTIEIERYSIPAEYEYRCVPKVNRDAFLLAAVTGWEQYNLLEGEANIFFENTFVGKTILDVRSPGDTLSVSLGRDKSIAVQREKMKEYSARKLLGSRIETTRDWKITVRNNRRQPVSMVIFDQIPVSTLQEIEVSAENLSGGTLNAETGEVKWRFILQPSKSSELELRYKVKYPKGRSLEVE
jgi:hypothetical protein